eukprot:COSAG04_NODE_23140_length_343_cov_0.840164_1_plen_64_part_10
MQGHPTLLATAFAAQAVLRWRGEGADEEGGQARQPVRLPRLAAAQLGGTGGTWDAPHADLGPPD